MNCMLHQDRKGIGECKLCGTAVCTECLTVIKGNVICPECITVMKANAQSNASTQSKSADDSSQAHFDRGSRQNAGDGFRADGQNGQSSSGNRQAWGSGGFGQPVNPTLESRSGFLTFVLSFLPGLGHLYLGLTRQGLELMGLFFGVIFLMVELSTPLPFAFVIPILFFYGIFDALQKRDRINRGFAVNPEATFFKGLDWNWVNRKWIGWGVVAIGGLMFLNKVANAGMLGRFLNTVGDIVIAFLFIAVGVWLIMREKRTAIPTDHSKEDSSHA